MKMQTKTKEQLTNELEKMRQRVAELEKVDAERKQAEEALKQSEQDYLALLETTFEGIIVVDAETLKVVYGNRRASKMFGFDPILKDGVGVNILDFVHPKDIGVVIKGFTEDLYQEERRQKYEVRAKTKDGGELWITALGTSTEFQGRLAVLLSTIDITERKRVEKVLRDSEAKLHLMFESISDGVIVSDLEGQIIDENKAAVRLQGYSDKVEVIGRNGFEFIAEKDRARATEDAMKSIEVGYGPAHEYTFVGKDGREYDAEASASVLRDSEGKAVGLISIFRDVTERKRVQEALKDSEEKLRLVFESITDGIVVTDLQGKIVDMNKAAVRLSGMSREEVINEDGLSLLKRKEHKDFIEMGKQALQGDMPIVITERKMAPSFNNSYDADISLGLLHDSAGNPAGYIAIIHDVTERKRAEEEKLKAITEKATVIDAMGDGLITLSMDGKILSLNPAMERLSGHNEDEFINKDGASLIHRFIKPEEQERISDIFVATLKGNIHGGTTFRILNRNGQDIPVFTTASFVSDAEGKPATIVVSFKDITDIKQAEEAQQESEERYKAIFNHSLFSVYVCDLKGNFLDVNDAALDLLGYTREEIQSLNFASLLDEEELPIAQQILANVKRTGFQEKTVEFKWRRKEGDYVLVETESAIINQEGKPYAIQGIAKDITESKKAKEALRESEEFSYSLIDNAPNPIVVINPDTSVRYVNPALEELTGFSQAELVDQKAPHPWWTAETAKKTSKNLEEAMLEGAKGLEELFQRKNGERFWVDITSTPIKRYGELDYYLANWVDITERRKAEEELRESEERYKAIFNRSLLCVYVSDFKGNFLDANDAALDLLGYTREDIQSLNFASLLEDKYIHEAMQIFDNVKRTGSQEKTGTVKLRRKDGDYVFAETETTLLYREGKPYAIQGIAKDITDRRRAEQEKLTAMTERAAVIDAMGDGLITIGMDGEILSMNSAMERLSGFTEDGFKNKDAASLITRFTKPEEHERLSHIFGATLKGDIPESVAFTLLDTEGREIPIYATTSFVLDEEGKPVTIIIMLKDITDIRQAEEELRESEEKYRLIAENVTDVIFTMDMNLRFTYISPSVTPQRGFSVEEAMALGVEKTLTPASLEIAANTILGGPPEEYMDEKKLHSKWTMELEMYCKDGSTIWTEAETTFLYDAKGKAVGFMGVARDITERRRAEQALRESEWKYRTVLETIEEGYYEVDLAGNLTFFNDSMCRIIGYPPDELMGMSNRRYMDDETSKAVYEVFNGVYRTGEPDRAFGWQVIRKDGIKSFVEASISLMSEPSGKPVGFRGIIRDITEHKQSEEALKASEEKLRAMFESITDGIVVTDLRGIITDVNDVVVHMQGRSREEIIGQDGFSLIPREDRDKVVDQGKKIVRGESGPVRMEHEISPIVGSSQTTNIIIGTMHDSDGNPTGFVAIAQDFTERKKAEEALKESEEKYRDLVESISDIIYSVDTNGVTTYISPVAESVLGYPPSELIGSSFADFMYQEDLQSATEGFMNNLSGNTTTGEFRVMTKSGEVRWVRSSNHPVFEEDRVIGVAGVLTDVTERKKAEEALRESEEKMRITFESIVDAVAVIDLEGRFVQVNEATARMSGYAKEELVGRNVLDSIIAKKDRDKIVLDMAQTLGEGDALGVRSYTLVDKDGREFDTEFSTAVLRDSSGNIISFVGVARDVTERKRAEQERERLLADLEDKSKELEQLLFISSHDLRSPLVNIQGFAREMELSLKEVRLSLEEEDIPPAVKEKLASPIDEDITDSLSYILASTSKIDTLLTGLLKVSRLGRATLSIEKLNMKNLMAEVVDSFEFQTREAGVKLEMGRLPQCRGDRAQLNQVFSNLIGNALKYLDPELPGIIRIYGRKEDSNVVYTVEDNGIGIAPEHQETVFQIFQRVDPTASSGEGLGLTIVRRILERHGGKTWLESEPGKGSRFHVSLPIRD